MSQSIYSFHPVNKKEQDSGIPYAKAYCMNALKSTYDSIIAAIY